MEELAALERVKGGRENEEGGVESGARAEDRSVLFSFRAGYSISTIFLYIATFLSNLTGHI